MSVAVIVSLPAFLPVSVSSPASFEVVSLCVPESPSVSVVVAVEPAVVGERLGRRAVGDGAAGTQRRRSSNPTRWIPRSTVPEESSFSVLGLARVLGDVDEPGLLSDVGVGTSCTCSSPLPVVPPLPVSVPISMFTVFAADDLAGDAERPRWTSRHRCRCSNRCRRAWWSRWPCSTRRRRAS